MCAEEIAAEIRRFVEEETLSGVSAESLTDDLPLVESGVVDSFDLAALVSHLQGRFSVSISPADMAPADFKSVATIAALFHRNRVEGVG